MTLVVCLSECASVTTVGSGKVDKLIDMLFQEAAGYGPKELNSVRRGCALAPPGEYNGLICVAVVMRPVDTVTAATRFFLSFRPFSAVQLYTPLLASVKRLL